MAATRGPEVLHEPGRFLPRALGPSKYVEPAPGVATLGIVVALTASKYTRAN